MPRKKIAFTIVVSEIEDKMIEDLKDLRMTSKAAVIRAAVTAMYNHETGRVFTCGDGRPCLVPQMQPPRQSRQIQPGPGIPLA